MSTTKSHGMNLGTATCVLQTKNKTLVSFTHISLGGRDSIVDIATGHGLTIRGLIPGGGGGQNIFSSPHPSRLTLGPAQSPVQWAPGFFPGGKTTLA